MYLVTSHNWFYIVSSQRCWPGLRCSDWTDWKKCNFWTFSFLLCGILLKSLFRERCRASIASLHPVMFKCLSAFIKGRDVYHGNAPYLIVSLTSSWQWWLTAWLMHELMVLQISVRPAWNETVSSFLNPLVSRVHSPAWLRHNIP